MTRQTTDSWRHTHSTWTIHMYNGHASAFATCRSRLSFSLVVTFGSDFGAETSYMERHVAQWASNLRAIRLAAQFIVPNYHARRNENLPDERSGPATWLQAQRLVALDGSSARVMLNREGVSTIMKRSHRPFGYMSGVLGQILSRIGQTEDMVLRC